MAPGRAGWKISIDRDYTTSVMQDVDGGRGETLECAGIMSM